MSVLEYLVAKSKIAKELYENSGRVTLEELLAPYCGVEEISHLTKLLECLPTLETEQLKISNCMLDGTLPYDSLVGLSPEDIKELTTVADYLYLPAELCGKLQSVLEKGTTGWTGQYDLLEFVKNGDTRGIEHIFDTFDKFHIDYTSVEDNDFVFNKAAQVAASHGQLDTLKWLDERLCCNYSTLCEAAAFGGHIECLKWLVEDRLKGKSIPESCSFERTARNGHIECLKYLHSCGFNLGIKEFNSAAGNGRLQCMQFLHEIGVPMSVGVFSAAAHYGNLDNLKWLREQGCPWNEKVPESAAGKGHLDCLIWLHEQGCPWDDSVTREAGRAGHLECLKYAHTHGCPWSGALWYCALQNNRLDCLKYAIEHGCTLGFTGYYYSFHKS